MFAFFKAILKIFHLDLKKFQCQLENVIKIMSMRTPLFYFNDLVINNSVITKMVDIKCLRTAYNKVSIFL